jgi:beta-phosphoglucomutase-like phosphatase (HAD superfamily)
MTTERRYYGPTAADYLVGMLKRRGITVDPARLEEHVAAMRDRQRHDDREHIAEVRRLASQVHKTRRAAEVASMMLRQDATPRHLAEVREALKAKDAAIAALREAVLYDEALYADVLRATRP